MDFLSFREEITKYIFAEDMLQNIRKMLSVRQHYTDKVMHHIFCQAENTVH